MKTVGRGKQEGEGKRGKGGGICETQFSCSEEMDRTEGVAGEGRVYGRGGGRSRMRILSGVVAIAVL